MTEQAFSQITSYPGSANSLALVEEKAQGTLKNRECIKPDARPNEDLNPMMSQRALRVDR